MQKVSVCIPTVGRTETLPTVLFSLLGQEGIKEVLILDDSAVPVCENFVVNQAIDLLSIYGVDSKIIRRRRRTGIGPSRVYLSEQAECDHIVMIDDDVVLGSGCIRVLRYHLSNGAPWVVPTCLLVPAGFEMDGYTDQIVDPNDPVVLEWTEQYPWFVPYFRYREDYVITDLKCSGTQCIGITKASVKKAASALSRMKKLPREDTVMTSASGPGTFDAGAICYHFEHKSQVTRGDWGRQMYYRLHEVAMRTPFNFVDMMGYQNENNDC